MPVEETKPGQEAQGGTAGNTQQSGAMGGTQGGGEQWTLDSAMAEIKKLRDENAERRVALKKQEDANAAAEQARLQEQGRYKELAESREKELNAAKPFQERATALEKIISDNNAQMIQQIPEQMRSIVPPLAADALNAWLTKNLPMLTRKPAPDTDAGAGQGGGTKSIVVTPQAEAAAAIAKEYGYNINPEAVAARAKQIDEQRRRPAKKDED